MPIDGVAKKKYNTGHLGSMSPARRTDDGLLSGLLRNLDALRATQHCYGSASLQRGVLGDEIALIPAKQHARRLNHVVPLWLPCVALVALLSSLATFVHATLASSLERCLLIRSLFFVASLLFPLWFPCGSLVVPLRVPFGSLFVVSNIFSCHAGFFYGTSLVHSLLFFAACLLHPLWFPCGSLVDSLWLSFRREQLFYATFAS